MFFPCFYRKDGQVRSAVFEDLYAPVVSFLGIAHRERLDRVPRVSTSSFSGDQAEARTQIRIAGTGTLGQRLVCLGLLMIALSVPMGCQLNKPGSGLEVAPEDTSITQTVTDAALDERPLEELLAQPVTLQAEGITADALAELLSTQLGAPVTVVLRDGPPTISVDFKKIPASELLQVLSRRGAAGVASGGQVFLCARDIDAEQLLGALSPLLGVKVSLTDGASTQRASFELKRMPMDQALELLGRRFGAIILDA